MSNRLSISEAPKVNIGNASQSFDIPVIVTEEGKTPTPGRLSLADITNQMPSAGGGFTPSSHGWSFLTSAEAEVQITSTLLTQHYTTRIPLRWERNEIFPFTGNENATSTAEGLPRLLLPGVWRISLYLCLSLQHSERSQAARYTTELIIATGNTTTYLENGYLRPRAAPTKILGGTAVFTTQTRISEPTNISTSISFKNIGHAPPTETNNTRLGIIAGTSLTRTSLICEHIGI